MTDTDGGMDWPETLDIPDTPGVYTFWDSAGNSLYVGKSSRLRRRLAGYRQGRLHGNMGLVLAHASHVTWVPLDSEAESLWVEANLIATTAPRYNIRARTNPAPYPYVLVTGGDIPRISTWRSGQPWRRGWRRFGPFPGQARNLVNTLSGTFGVRPCSDAKLRQHQRMHRPCLLGETGKCAAPCLSTEGYSQRVGQVLSFLDGDTRSALDTLEREMMQAAQNRNFEHATLLRDRIALLSSYQNTRTLAESRGRIDALGVSGDDLGWACVALHARDGILLGTSTVEVESVGDRADTTTALLTGAARIWADSGHGLPEKAVSLTSSEDLNSLLGLIQSKPSGSPQRVLLKKQDIRIATAAQEAAAQALTQARRARLADTSTRTGEMSELGSALGVDALFHIECLDISHWAGTATVAGLSVLIDALPDSGRERTWDLPDSADDYASIKLAVKLRLTADADTAHEGTQKVRRWAAGELPDLLLIDGGPLQVAAAVEVTQELGVEVAIAGLAKRLEELWLPGQTEPVILPRDSAGLYLLQRARDRAHRIAITRQRTLRRRALLKADLGEIAGLGGKRRARLLREAGGLENLLGVSANELKSKFPWLPEDVCGRLAQHCALPQQRSGN